MHREWAAAALERGWLVLWTLEIAGAAVASVYVFRFGGVDWFYQSGRDARYDRDRVGFVLLCHAIEDACTTGQDAFSLLLGDEAYKDRFADSDPGLEHVVTVHGARGRAALAAAQGGRLALRARDAVRRLSAR
jgi:CelD/BcsL family acetyltransferase involved in cellulose biosynthesis